MNNSSKAFYSHPASYYKVKTGYGELHVHVDLGDQGQTVRVFTNISPVGSEIAGMTSALGIVISKYLEQGGDLKKIVKHLGNIRGDKSIGIGKDRVDSIPAAVASVLKKCIKEEELVPA